MHIRGGGGMNTLACCLHAACMTAACSLGQAASFLVFQTLGVHTKPGAPLTAGTAQQLWHLEAFYPKALLLVEVALLRVVHAWSAVSLAATAMLAGEP